MKAGLNKALDDQLATSNNELKSKSKREAGVHKTLEACQNIRRVKHVRASPSLVDTEQASACVNIRAAINWCE